jgi:nucleotide-binding universal stress UspA family protein
MIKQILLSLPTYPDRPPPEVLESAAVLARYLDSGLTAQIAQLSREQSTWPPVIGAFPLDFPQLMNDSVLLSEANAEVLSAELSRVCSEFAVTLDLRRSLSTLYPAPSMLVDLARLHDLLVLPVPQIDSFDRAFVEAAIFDTGRPTLLLPSGQGRKSLNWLEEMVVAWDYSREAARALTDALPILVKAKRVHVVSVLGEKGIHTTAGLGDLEKFLASHQVHHVMEQRMLREGGIAKTLADYAVEVDADLLVMGAYGHARAREFLLGGATQGILSEQTLPVFLSR